MIDVDVVVDDDQPRTGTLTIVRHVNGDARARRVVDPAWTYVDPAGHFHAADADHTTPTLYQRVEDRPLQERVSWRWADCGDLFEYTTPRVVDYCCRVCHAIVERPTIQQDIASTRKEWTVHVHRLALTPGGKHTVRAHLPDGTIMFGVAVAGNVSAMAWIAELHGVGALGKRPAPAGWTARTGGGS